MDLMFKTFQVTVTRIISYRINTFSIMKGTLLCVWLWFVWCLVFFLSEFTAVKDA